MIKKYFFTVVFIFVTVVSFSAQSINNKVATITKYDDAMFWEINGWDREGNPSTIYVLGTFHAGDDRIYPLPEVILNAYADSDRFVSEVALSDWSRIIPETFSRQMISAQKEAKRVEETGKTLIEYFTSEEIDFLISVLGDEQTVNSLTMFEPWVLSSVLASVSITQTSLDPEKGVDQFILNKCIEDGNDVEGLEPLETQFDIITFGDWDTQLAMLKDVIKEYIEDPEKSITNTKELYEAYLSADEDYFYEIFEETEEDDDAEYAEDYYNVIFLDRNTVWADNFANYLLDGGTTFVFAGTGHFIGNDSVFNIMRKNKTLE